MYSGRYCIFVEQIEVCGVVFPAVGVQIAENAHARLLIHKKKSAEIARKS